MDRFFTDQLGPGLIQIEDKELLKHMFRVLRLKKGDQIELVDGKGQEYIYSIDSISTHHVSLNHAIKVEKQRELEVEIVLWQAMPKASKLETIIQKSTELGVACIHPIFTKRSVVSEKVKSQKLVRWNKIAKEAAKQSKRLVIPPVYEPVPFLEAFDNLNIDETHMVCYEQEINVSIKDFLEQHLPLTNLGRLNIWIGPEGGWDHTEIDIMKKQQIASVHLGNRIVRTETASIVALSMIQYQLLR